MPIITFYNPIYKNAEETYVCDTPDELQTLYNSIDLETLSITNIQEHQGADKKTQYNITL